MRKLSQHILFFTLVCSFLSANALNAYCAWPWKEGARESAAPAKKDTKNLKTAAVRPVKPRSVQATQRPVVDKKAVAVAAASRPGKKMAAPVALKPQEKVNTAREGKQEASKDAKVLTPVAKALIASENVKRVQQQLERIFKVNEEVRQRAGTNALRVQNMVDQARRHQDILLRANQQMKFVNQRALSNAGLVLQNAKLRQIREQAASPRQTLMGERQLALNGAGQQSSTGALKPASETRRPA